MMRFPRAWRQKKEPTIDHHLTVVTDSVEDLAGKIFEHVLVTGQPMPARFAIETGVKKFMLEFLQPAREHAIQAGKPAAEVEAYADVVTSHAQVAFQTKWKQLEHLHAQRTAGQGVN